MALLATWRRPVFRYPRPLLLAAGCVALAGLGSWHVDFRSLAFLLMLGALVGAGAAISDAADSRRAASVVFGMHMGLGVAAAVGVVQVLGSDVLGVPVRASGWWPHANVWGASVLIPTMAVVFWGAKHRRAYLALGSVAFGLTVVLTSGSRSALIALAVGLVFTTIAARREGGPLGWGGGAATIGAVATLAVVIFGVESGWRPRIVDTFGSSVQSAAVGSTNLFQASEDLRDDVWWAPNVEAARVPSDSVGVHRLRRTGGRWTDRIQQRVPIDPGVAYTFSAEIRGPSEAQPDPVPAVVVWAEIGGDVFEIVVRLPRDGVPIGYANGLAALLAVRSIPVGEGFWRLEVVFESHADGATNVEAGVAPRTVETIAASVGVDVRRVQVQRGESTAYVPTAAPDRSSARAASAVATRVNLYRDLAPRIAERPMTGWGPTAFAGFVAAGGATAIGGVSHEHSLVLWFLHRYGVFGLVAYVAVLWGLGGRSPLAWSFVVAVVLANAVDVTFLSDAVYVTTAVACGAARGRAARSTAPALDSCLQREERRRG